MLNMGSKCIADLSWPFRFAARATGDGAKLANWGSGEKEKLGLYGMFSPEVVAVGGFKEVWLGGGVYGGIEGLFGRLALLSLGPGLGLEFVSEVAASDALCSRMRGGCFAEVGVGRGGGCDCIDNFVVVVDLRFLFGWPLEY
jgi:hypothetical protein